MTLRGSYNYAVQHVRASRLYKSNPEARRQLDALGQRAENDTEMTRAEYLGREREIVDRHRSQ